ncbi:MAG: peptide-methionine (S)-S-oxide reductase MsrA [Betaproteobacteria bacterium]|nr:peptide-methionine (S)-S-oxide reductase MsrA [Betaproteobacteria bacterium]
MQSITPSESRRTEIATLAGGCFWCLEAVFLDLEGVLSVQSGYAGGHVAHPTYRDVCDGETGHAEVVRIEFDPAQVSYRDLLEVFFTIHDPTTPDRQGNDVGTQYRSAIHFHSAAQERTARDLVAELEKDRVFPSRIVTEIVPAPEFYPAEDYHDDYFARNSQQPYCQFVVAPKLAKFRAKFAARSRRR